MPSLIDITCEFCRNRHLFPGLDMLHANGVRAHQPRLTPWETGLQWHMPPCKGGGNFHDLRPFRAPEHSVGPAFPGCYPGLVCCALSAHLDLGDFARQRSGGTSAQGHRGCRAPSGAACQRRTVRRADMPLLTELEGSVEAPRSYKYAAPNGAVTQVPRSDGTS
jgi:hypothetical protein